jgi:hypothetical protein
MTIRASEQPATQPPRRDRRTAPAKPPAHRPQRLDQAASRSPSRAAGDRSRLLRAGQPERAGAQERGPLPPSPPASGHASLSRVTYHRVGCLRLRLTSRLRICASTWHRQGSPIDLSRRRTACSRREHPVCSRDPGGGGRGWLDLVGLHVRPTRGQRKMRLYDLISKPTVQSDHRHDRCSPHLRCGHGACAWNDLIDSGWAALQPS